MRSPRMSLRRLGMEGDRKPEGLVVFREADEDRRLHHRPPLQLAGKGLGPGAGQRVGELARAVGAEVEEDHGVAVAQPRPALDHGRLHELVALVPRVGLLDRGERVRGAAALAGDDRLVGGRDPLPALIAVHRVVAPRHGRHASAAGLELREELAQEAEPRARRRVAPVQEDVQGGAHAPLAAMLEQRRQVLLVAVDAAVGEEAHQVQRDARPGGGLERLRQGGIPLQLVAPQRLSDPRDVHLDDAPGAHRHVADFGVAHLAGRQPHRLARGLDPGAGMLAAGEIQERRVRAGGRIVRAAVADPEAVQHHQHHRPRHHFLLRAAGGETSSGVASLQRRSRS